MEICSNATCKLRNQNVHRRDSVSPAMLSEAEIKERVQLGLIEEYTVKDHAREEEEVSYNFYARMIPRLCLKRPRARKYLFFRLSKNGRGRLGNTILMKLELWELVIVFNKTF